MKDKFCQNLHFSRPCNLIFNLILNTFAAFLISEILKLFNVDIYYVLKSPRDFLNSQYQRMWIYGSINVFLGCGRVSTTENLAVNFKPMFTLPDNLFLTKKQCFHLVDLRKIACPLHGNLEHFTDTRCLFFVRFSGWGKDIHFLCVCSVWSKG